MSQVTIDPTLQERLKDLKGVTNFVDEKGVAVGSFVPADVRLRELYALAHSQISDQEIEALRHEGGPEYTLDEILRDLSSR